MLHFYRNKLVVPQVGDIIVGAKYQPSSPNDEELARGFARVGGIEVERVVDLVTDRTDRSNWRTVQVHLEGDPWYVTWSPPSLELVRQAS